MIGFRELGALIREPRVCNQLEGRDLKAAIRTAVNGEEGGTVCVGGGGGSSCVHFNFFSFRAAEVIGLVPAVTSHTTKRGGGNGGSKKAGRVGKNAVTPCLYSISARSTGCSGGRRGGQSEAGREDTYVLGVDLQRGGRRGAREKEAA